MAKSEEKILSKINNNKIIENRLNSNAVSKNTINITNEHESFINYFNVLMSNISIYLEYNAPSSKEEKEQAILIRDEFWQKIYFFYLY